MGRRAWGVLAMGCLGVGCVAGAQAVAPGGGLVERMQRVAALTSLDVAGRTPWHLKLNVELPGAGW